MKQRSFFSGDDILKKFFWLISAVCVFLCGVVLQISYEASGHVAWSLVVSSVNNSPWELVKPFILTYIMWSFIELSVLRPSLLHFVCSKIISLHFFVIVSSTVLCFVIEQSISFVVIFSIIIISELLCYLIYRSKCRIELFFIPIIISFGILFFCILFCSFYPPCIMHFYDRVSRSYGLADVDFTVIK